MQKINLLTNNQIIQFSKDILKISDYLDYLYSIRTYEEEPLPLLNYNENLFKIFSEWFEILNKTLQFDIREQDNNVFKPEFFNDLSINQKIELFNFGLGNQIRILCETLACSLSECGCLDSCGCFNYLDCCEDSKINNLEIENSQDENVNNHQTPKTRTNNTPNQQKEINYILKLMIEKYKYPNEIDLRKLFNTDIDIIRDDQRLLDIEYCGNINFEHNLHSYGYDNKISNKEITVALSDGFLSDDSLLNGFVKNDSLMDNSLINYQQEPEPYKRTNNFRELYFDKIRENIDDELFYKLYTAWDKFGFGLLHRINGIFYECEYIDENKFFDIFEINVNDLDVINKETQKITKGSLIDIEYDGQNVYKYMNIKSLYNYGILKFKHGKSIFKLLIEETFKNFMVIMNSCLKCSAILNDNKIFEAIDDYYNESTKDDYLIYKNLATDNTSTYIIVSTNETDRVIHYIRCNKCNLCNKLFYLDDIFDKHYLIKTNSFISEKALDKSLGEQKFIDQYQGIFMVNIFEYPADKPFPATVEEIIKLFNLNCKMENIKIDVEKEKEIEKRMWYYQFYSKFEVYKLRKKFLALVDKC